MGIKHSVTKASGEEGYASEWNDEHIIDSDLDMNGYGLFNTAFVVNDFGNLLISADQYLEISGALGIIVDNEVNMSSQKITGLANPTSAQDAVTKDYVDNIAGGVTKGYQVNFSEGNIGTSWHYVPGAGIYLRVYSGQMVFISVTGIADLDTSDADLDLKINRSGADISNMGGIGNLGGTDSSLPFCIQTLDVPGNGYFNYRLRANSDESNTDIDDGKMIILVFG